jgi:hypothetical protein
MRLADGANRVVCRMHVGKVIARRLEILAHLHVFFHVLDPHLPIENLGQVVGDLPKPLAHFGCRNPIRHAFVDAKHEGLHRRLRATEQRQEGAQAYDQSLHAQ